MARWVGGWVGGWMGGWMYGWVKSGLSFRPRQSPHHSKRTFLKDKQTSTSDLIPWTLPASPLRTAHSGLPGRPGSPHQHPAWRASPRHDFNLQACRSTGCHECSLAGKHLQQKQRSTRPAHLPSQRTNAVGAQPLLTSTEHTPRGCIWRHPEVFHIQVAAPVQAQVPGSGEAS